MPSRVAVVVAASGAPWEAQALQLLGATGQGTTLLKRCVDLNDLLATASTGQATAALVSFSLPGLDADSLRRLAGDGVATVLVASAEQCAAGGRERAMRLGASYCLESTDMTGLPAAVLCAVARQGAGSGDAVDGEAAGDGEEASRGSTAPRPSQVLGHPFDSSPIRPGRVIAVWGPAGAPGRTTMAVGVAAELAERGSDTLLIDADAYGGAVAQHLGVLEETSGLLAAARLANAGQLDAGSFAAAARQVSPHLRLLTGLPRADRWSEVRDSSFEQILDRARSGAEWTVLDLGFSIEEDDAGAFGTTAPQRNAMTLAALDEADELVVVGSADPVGLARLARALVELLEMSPGRSLHVVVNRARSSLGWSENDVRGMVEGFVVPASMHFVPDDRAAADRALVNGRSLVETGSSALSAAVATLASTVAGGHAQRQPRRGIRLRRAARAR